MTAVVSSEAAGGGVDIVVVASGVSGGVESRRVVEQSSVRQKLEQRM